MCCKNLPFQWCVCICNSQFSFLVSFHFIHSFIRLCFHPKTLDWDCLSTGTPTYITFDSTSTCCCNIYILSVDSSTLANVRIECMQHFFPSSVSSSLLFFVLIIIQFHEMRHWKEWYKIIFFLCWPQMAK